jgi:hypothetical protein
MEHIKALYDGKEYVTVDNRTYTTINSIQIKDYIATITGK